MKRLLTLNEFDNYSAASFAVNISSRDFVIHFDVATFP